MEKELIESLIQMRVALAAVLKEVTTVETMDNGQPVEVYNLTNGTLDIISESDSKATELLLQAGVDPNDMPA